MKKTITVKVKIPSTKNHLIKNVEESDWKRFRILSIQLGIPLAKVLARLLDQHEQDLEKSA